MSKTYTVKQVAEILGYSTNSIYTFLDEGRIKGVRVGKGRFRIPEEELNRVLHLSKKADSAIVVQGEQVNVANQVLANENAVKLEPQLNLFSLQGVYVASIFDWFVGSVAIVLGMSFILYGNLKGKLEFAQFLPWLRTFQITFIAGGIGLIITDLMHKQISTIWHRFFHIVLAIVFGAFSFVSLKINDPAVFVIFGLLAIITLIKQVIRLRGVKAFLLFLILSGIGLGIEFMVGIFVPANPVISALVGENRAVIGAIWIAVFVIVGFFLWVGERKPSIMFWFLMILVGALLILDSIFFANQLAWSRSFFLLVTGLTCFLLPVWIVLRIAHDSQRRALAFAFGIMVTLLVSGIVVIWVIQQSTIEYAGRELRSKLDFSNILVSKSLARLEDSLRDIGTNQALVEAVKGEDREQITELLKLIFINNKNLGRFIALRQDGSMLSSYPLEDNFGEETVDKSHLPEQVRNSVLFFDRQNKSSEHSQAVGMSTQLLDSEEVPAGVIMAHINLIKLKSDLQELANPENEEYFVVFNKNGEPIINDDKKLNFRASVVLNKDLEESYNYQGRRVFRISETIDKYGWKIELNSSVDKIFSPTKIVSISIFLLAVIFVGGMCLWLVIEKRRFAPK